MKTHLEFTSTAFPAYPGEDKEINPGIFGKRVAEFLAESLPQQGFKVLCIGAEDWGWMVEIENREFPLPLKQNNILGRRLMISKVKPNFSPIRSF